GVTSTAGSPARPAERPRGARPAAVLQAAGGAPLTDGEGVLSAVCVSRRIAFRQLGKILDGQFPCPQFSRLDARGGIESRRGPDSRAHAKHATRERGPRWRLR